MRVEGMVAITRDAHLRVRLQTSRDRVLGSMVPMWHGLAFVAKRVDIGCLEQEI